MYMKTIPFIKMHGLGNDYVYIDCFSKETAAIIAKTDLPELARRVSDRHFGIGSDGLVLIRPIPLADAQMRIFNADGSEAEMCGNAIRCVAKYLYECGLRKNLQMDIATLAGIRTLNLQVVNGIVEQVTVNMGVPSIKPEVLQCGADPIGYTSVNMGNPHAVFFHDSVPQLPENTNIEFVRVRNNTELDVRVIERGSGETLAECEAFAKAHGLVDVVRFEREMPHERLADFYRSLDLFVLPSTYWEGFCCVYAEALACGVPVMGCHGISFLDETLSETDRREWLVPPHDAAALADRILKWWKCAERGKVPELTGDLDIDHLIGRWLDFVQTAAR